MFITNFLLIKLLLICCLKITSLTKATADELSFLENYETTFLFTQSKYAVLLKALKS